MIVVKRCGEHETVRLIGVDTPGTVHPRKPVEPYGKEASAFTRNELLGERVRLIFGHPRRDRYGRLSAINSLGELVSVQITVLCFR